jgi:tetratricopeptide (TPR) repeat protein
LAISRESDDQRGIGQDLGNLGDTYLALGDLPRALSCLTESLNIFRQIGGRRSEGITLSSLGDAHLAAEETRVAPEYYQQAYGLAVEGGDLIEEAKALCKQSKALALCGELEQAIHLAEEALTLFERIESPLTAAARETLALWRKQSLKDDSASLKVHSISVWYPSDGSDQAIKTTCSSTA